MKKTEYDTCLRCGKVLKDITSKTRGYGSYCFKKYLKERYKQLSLFGLNK